jgi:hypothetical protein
MAETNAEIGYDDRLQFEVTDGDGDFTDIEEMKDFPEFGDDFDLIEVTHKTSPNRRKEYVSGMADAAEQGFEANYVRGTVQDAVRAAKGTTRNFRLIYMTTPPLVITFPALIKAAKITSPTNDARKLMLTLKPTGDFEETSELPT